MAEKTPDADRSGIDRRNVLKGLGFTALGGGALANRVAAQDDEDAGSGDYVPITTCGEDALIDYAMLVNPGEDPDEDNRRDQFTDEPTGGMDLLFQLDSPGVEQGDSHTIAYQVAFVRQNEDSNVATKSVEDGRTRGFAGTVRTTPGGETRLREEFSTSGLSGGEGRYWVILMVADYAQLPDSLPMEGGAIPVQIN